VEISTEPVADLPPPPIYVVCVGRKGRGKSELAWLLWDSWDGDRVVIDTTGSVGEKHPDPDEVLLAVPPPARWPDGMRRDGERMTLRYVPDHAAEDWREDMDRVVGMAMAKGDCLLWIEESGLLAPANRVPPNVRAANQMGRHKNLSKIDTMPRPVDVDPLILAQADIIYAFDVPNPDDRKRLADVTGFDRRLVDEVNFELGPHDYARYHLAAREVAIFPAIPLPKQTRRIERYIDDNPTPGRVASGD
jgi:hypothetical protein